MSDATSGVVNFAMALPDIAEPVIGPARGGTRWLIRAARHLYNSIEAWRNQTVFDGATEIGPLMPNTAI
jgi:hypothetical protein